MRIKYQKTNEILAGISECCRDVFDNDALAIWDSLAQLQLVASVEKRFKIRLASSGFTGFKTAGGMCSAVKSKLL